MREKVVTLLTALGMTETDSDALLDVVMENVQWRIKNETNQNTIPEGLEGVAVNMAVGEYLSLKKNSGQLDVAGLDLDVAVKSIQEGDTNTTFAIGEGSATPEQRLESLIQYLNHGRSGEFLRYRRLIW